MTSSASSRIGEQEVRQFGGLGNPEQPRRAGRRPFAEVAPPERLVFTSAALDGQGRPLFEVRNTVTFAPDGPRTVLTVWAEITAEAALADPCLAGRTVGWSQGLERLTALVAGFDDLGCVLVVERVFEASPEALFRAWTDPAQVARWWGPRRLATRVGRMEVRPGGPWRIVQTDPGGGEYAFEGEYREVEPGRRLACTQRFEGHGALSEVRFRDLGGRTGITVVVRFGSMGEREGAARAGMEQGIAESLDRLAELAASGTEIVMTRVFAAPRDLIFQLWTDPAHVVRWWGPNGFTTAVHAMDVRPGGA